MLDFGNVSTGFPIGNELRNGFPTDSPVTSVHGQQAVFYREDVPWDVSQGACDSPNGRRWDALRGPWARGCGPRGVRTREKPVRWPACDTVAFGFAGLFVRDLRLYLSPDGFTTKGTFSVMPGAPFRPWRVGLSER